MDHAKKIKALEQILDFAHATLKLAQAAADKAARNIVFRKGET